MPKPQEQAQSLDSQRIGKAIRQRRKALNLTLTEVCDKVGLSAGFLSLVERGKATPSLGSLANIAGALGVSLDYFIAVPWGNRGISFAAHRAPFDIGPDGMRYERISAEFPEGTLNSVVIHVPPGFVSEEVSREGEEIVYVIDGLLRLTLDNVPHALSPGDSAHFGANILHRWSNMGPGWCRLLWVGTSPIFPRGDVAMDSKASGWIVPPGAEEV